MAADIGARIGIDGERAFRDSLGAINSQMRALGTEMQSVVSAFTGMEDSEQSVTARTDVLQRSIGTAQEKIQLLTGQSDRAKTRLAVLATELENAKNAFGENSVEAANAQNAYNRQVTAVNRLQTQINTTTTEMNRMQTEMQQLGGSTDDLTGEFGETERSANTLSDVFKGSFAAGIATAGVKALADGLKSLVGALKDTVVGTAQYADDIATLSVQTGISTDKLQEYNYMTGLADVELETITGSMAKLTKNMATAQKGTGDAAAAFEALGVSTTNSDGSLRDNEAVFGDVINRLGEMTNETERDAYAMQIFGKSAQDLNPLIALGADGFNALAQEAKDMGYVLDEDASGSMLAVADAMDRTERAADTIKNQISTQLAPVITELTDSFIAWAQSVDWDAVGEKIGGVMESVAGFIKEIIDNKDMIIAAISGIATGLLAWSVAGMIMGVVAAVKAFREANTTATVAQALFNTVMGANPAVKIAMLIIGIVTALVTFIATNDEARAKVVETWDALKEHVAGTIEGIKKTVDDMKEKFRSFVEWFAGIPSQMKEIGKNLITGLWNGINDKVEWLKGKVSGVVDKIKGWFTGSDGFDTHSPSKWTEKIGGWVMQGLGIGMRKDTTALSAARNATAKIGGVIKKEIEATNAAIQKMQSDAAKAQAEEEIRQYKESLRQKTEELKKAEKKDRQSILDEIAKMESDWNKKQADAAEKAEQEKLNKKLTALQEFQTEYETALSEIENKQKTLDDKLFGYGELFEKSKSEDGKDLFELGDIEDDIKKIEKFGEAVDKVKEKGISSDLLAEISGMDMDDAVLYMDKLNSLSDSTFDEYVKSYQEKQTAANEVAKKFYADEILALEANTLNTITNFEGDFIDVGKMLTDGVSNGIENGKSGLIDTITSVLRAAVNAAREEMDINSPSGVFEEIGDYMGQGLDVGWIGRMKSVTANIRNSMADIAKTPNLSMAGGGNSTSKSYAFGDTNVYIGSVNSSTEAKVLAQELEFERRMKVNATGGR